MNDRSTVNLVIGLLGTFAILGMGAAFALAWDGHDLAVWSPFLGVTIAASGVIGGLLASTKTAPADPAPVLPPPYAPDGGAPIGG